MVGAWSPDSRSLAFINGLRDPIELKRIEVSGGAPQTLATHIDSRPPAVAWNQDGVILSVLLGVSQITRVAETADRLKAIGAKLVGVVVNGVPSEAYRVAARYGSRAAYARPSDGGHSPEPRAAGV